MRIVDSHVHFWHPKQLRYSWLDNVPKLKRPFLPGDYGEATQAEVVSEIVFVQADCLPAQSLAEVDWVAGLDAPVGGIVGFAPLELGEAVRPQLEQLRQRPLVKGVRRLLQSEADDFARQPAFRRGVQLLAEYDLRFDICIKHQQLPAVIDLVAACPDVSFVLDHIGKPAIAGGEMTAWRRQLQTLAQFDHVYCKLSGVITEATPGKWTVEEIRPYLEHTVAVFGSRRVMFGSDWPVVNLAGSFGSWLNALQPTVAGLSAAERERFFYQNCRDFYGLDSGS